MKNKLEAASKTRPYENNKQPSTDVPYTQQRTLSKTKQKNHVDAHFTFLVLFLLTLSLPPAPADDLCTLPLCLLRLRSKAFE